MNFNALNRKPYYFAKRDEVVELVGGFKKTEEGNWETDPIRIKDLYINPKSDFGPQPVVVCYDLKFDEEHDVVAFNMPDHMLHACEDLVKDAPTMSCIKRGDAAVILYKYEIPDKQDKRQMMQCVGAKWTNWD